MEKQLETFTEIENHYGRPLPHEHCGWCGTNILSLCAGKIGCRNCNHEFNGQWGRPIGSIELPEAEQREVNRRWMASKVEKYGSLEAFFATGCFSDDFKKDLIQEWENMK